MNGGAAVDPVSRETGDKNRRQPDRADRTIASAAIRCVRRDRSRLQGARCERAEREERRTRGSAIERRDEAETSARERSFRDDLRATLVMEAPILSPVFVPWVAPVFPCPRKNRRQGDHPRCRGDRSHLSPLAPVSPVLGGRGGSVRGDGRTRCAVPIPDMDRRHSA